MKTSSIKKALLKKTQADAVPPSLSSGSTVLNMHMTGTTTGGYRAGKYYAIIGDSSAGKTWLCFTAFAEAKLSEHFKHHRLIYDNVEDGADMDVQRYFGKAVMDSLEPPAGTREDPVYSHTAEDFQDNLDNAIKDGRPFIYVLDSIDGLTTLDDVSKYEEQKTARVKGKEVSGSYGMSKAKRLKATLREATSTKGLRKSGSILIVLCQTIDNVGFGFAAKDRAGGNAITFFATVDMWLSVKKTLMSGKVRGKERPVGVESLIVLKKNRITGKKNEKTVIHIYNSFGIDEVGGMVDYLVDEGYWKKGTGGIVAGELGVSGTRESVIKQIEDGNLEKKVRIEVRKCYRQIAEATEVHRKPRYQ